MLFLGEDQMDKKMEERKKLILSLLICGLLFLLLFSFRMIISGNLLCERTVIGIKNALESMN